MVAVEPVVRRRDAARMTSQQGHCAASEHRVNRRPFQKSGHSPRATQAWRWQAVVAVRAPKILAQELLQVHGQALVVVRWDRPRVTWAVVRQRQALAVGVQQRQALAVEVQQRQALAAEVLQHQALAVALQRRRVAAELPVPSAWGQ